MANKNTSSKTNAPGAPVAVNRKARFEYAIEEEMEAGLVLTGTEVKPVRAGKVNINDAYAGEKGGEIWLFNAIINEYERGNRFNHEPRRPRKLLLQKKQVKKLIGRLKVKGTTLIPLSLYFNNRGFAKLKIGLATGKKQYEKREAIRDRDWKREQARIMKNK